MALLEHIASYVNAFNILKKPVDWYEIHAQIGNFSGSHRELKALYEKYYFQELERVVLIQGISGLEIAENQLVCNIALLGFPGLHSVVAESIPIEIFRDFLAKNPDSCAYVCRLCSEEYLGLLCDRFGQDIGLTRKTLPYKDNYGVDVEPEDPDIFREEQTITEYTDQDGGAVFEKMEQLTGRASESSSRPSDANRQETSPQNISADQESSNSASNIQNTSESAAERSVPLVFRDIESAYAEFPGFKNARSLVSQRFDAISEMRTKFIVPYHMDGAQTTNKLLFYFDNGTGTIIHLTDLPSIPHLYVVYNAAVADHLRKYYSAKLSFTQDSVVLLGKSLLLDELPNLLAEQISFNLLTFNLLIYMLKQ